jgi:hypothetical protein
MHIVYNSIAIVNAQAVVLTLHYVEKKWIKSDVMNLMGDCQSE